MKPEMIYPQSYLDGNISLQETIETCHKNTIRRSLDWLAMSVWFFVLLLAGITFESAFLSVFAILELIISTIALYIMQSIPKEYQ
jgi:hypothetical protein